MKKTMFLLLAIVSILLCTTDLSAQACANLDGEGCANGGYAWNWTIQGDANTLAILAGTCGDVYVSINNGPLTSVVAGDTFAIAAGDEVVIFAIDLFPATFGLFSCPEVAFVGVSFTGPTCTQIGLNPAATGHDCLLDACPNCGSDSCVNGVQDGDETGVDCGGSCPTPCAAGVPTMSF